MNKTTFINKLLPFIDYLLPKSAAEEQAVTPIKERVDAVLMKSMSEIVAPPPVPGYPKWRPGIEHGRQQEPSGQMSARTTYNSAKRGRFKHSAARNKTNPT